MPTPTDLYVPVLDISEHQGTVDFATMRDRGVDGLIIRTNHALNVDKRCVKYVLDARAAGYRDDQFGFYTFCNPKRASGADSGKAFVDTVRSIFGHTRTVLMLDVEAYESQSGGSLPVIKGPAFATWIREHIDTVHQLAPDAYLIAYSNAAFWNPWVGDKQLASELEWIVPRYPAYSAAAYQKNPLPTTPVGWPEWAWRVGPTGPKSPSGVAWDGWQFSAGWNQQGARYGCQSSDLDLNIVEQSAWRRWTRTDTPAPIPIPPIPVPPIPVEEDMKAILYTVTDPAVGGAWFYVSPERNVACLEAVAEYDVWVAAGALEREVPAAEFRLQVATFQPVGRLNVPAQNVLGAEVSADWKARATPPSGGGGGGPFPVYTVEAHTLIPKI